MRSMPSTSNMHDEFMFYGATSRYRSSRMTMIWDVSGSSKDRTLRRRLQARRYAIDLLPTRGADARNGRKNSSVRAALPPMADAVSQLGRRHCLIPAAARQYFHE